LLDFNRTNFGQNFFFPPWIFDYPKFVYNDRNKILKKLSKISSAKKSVWGDADFNPIPVCIGANVDLKKLWDKKSLDKWEWDLFYEFFNRKYEYKLSLPFTYLTILKHFLNMISKSTTSEMKSYNPKKYRKFLFYDDISPVNAPLFLYDPLKTISCLIKSLTTLWTGDLDLLQSFKIFRLINFNILQGKSLSDNQWKTLIAYCGGWTEKGKCGKNPLVLGKHEHCPQCGKLICKDCKFCNINCERYKSLSSYKSYKLPYYQESY